MSQNTGARGPGGLGGFLGAREMEYTGPHKLLIRRWVIHTKGNEE